MNNFYNNLKSVQDNVSITENGMQGYKHTDHAMVDFNFKIPSYRDDKKSDIEALKKKLKEEDANVLKYLMYLRDAREGVGERDLFRVCLKEFLKSNFVNKDEVVDKIITSTAEYGRFDDLFVLFDTPYKESVVNYLHNQLREDFKNYQQNKPISLLAKWLPSENTSSKKTREVARFLIDSFKTSPKWYRKTLSTLRSYLDVTEVKTCANDWNDIDYNKVPSKANLKYKEAFLRHDEERRREFLSKALSGSDEVKVHMGVAFPHEIVHQYHYGNFDQSLEAYWKNLKPCVGLKDTIVVRDGSGSMCCRVGGTNVTAMDVSTALAIYCSQFLCGEFKNKFITFSSQAQLVDLSGCGSLKSKLAKTHQYGDCTNTNIQNVFELILNTAIESNMKQEEMPSSVLIISDMEFDPSSDEGYYWGGFNAGANVFKTMSAKFKAHGYELPKLVFWNVNSRTNTIPCKYNENGVLLISGFSQNVLNMVMNGETDPYVALVKELNGDRYSNIPLIEFIKTYDSGVGTLSNKIINTPEFLK